MRWFKRWRQRKYQRPIDQEMVDKIVREWDPKLVAPIVIKKRGPFA